MVQPFVCTAIVFACFGNAVGRSTGGHGGDEKRTRFNSERITNGVLATHGGLAFATDRRTCDFVIKRTSILLVFVVGVA